jgi:hypothetical protein
MEAELPVFPADKKGIASVIVWRAACLRRTLRGCWVSGGSRAVNQTLLKLSDAGNLSASNGAGRNMHFGIREHAMGAIVNGPSLSKIRPYGSTFLIFSAKPAIRPSALMEVPVISSPRFNWRGGWPRISQSSSRVAQHPGLITSVSRRQRSRRIVAPDHGFGTSRSLWC